MPAEYRLRLMAAARPRFNLIARSFDTDGRPLGRRTDRSVSSLFPEGKRFQSAGASVTGLSLVYVVAQGSLRPTSRRFS